MTHGTFKSCWTDRIYELNAHKRHHKVFIMSGKLEFPSWGHVSEICIQGKFAHMIKLLLLFFFLVCKIKLHKLHIQNIIV